SRPPAYTRFPYTTLFRSRRRCCAQAVGTPFANTPFANRYAAITFPTQKTKYARDNTSQTKYRVDATGSGKRTPAGKPSRKLSSRSEEHTSELQSRGHLVC